MSARKKTDKDEVELAKLAKKLLSMPHKPREESKVGKPKTKKSSTKEKKRA